MDRGFHKRMRGIKHKTTAMPFYPPRPPAAAPATAAEDMAKPKKASLWPTPTSPPPSVVAVDGGVYNSGGPGAGGDADVDRQAEMYISRVLERLRRELVTEDLGKCY
ncbi:hypothetical protein ACP70R_009642 [Stipagrostis hirtigluma subsp. patula]